MIRYDIAYEKNALRNLVMDSFKLLGIERTARLLDSLKDAGFELSTTTGITIGIDDVAIPPQKRELVDAAQKQLEAIEALFDEGFATEEERLAAVIRLWSETTEQVKQAVFRNFEDNMPFNPLFVMAQSGARGSPQQIVQLAGMRGLMAKPSGEASAVPLRDRKGVGEGARRGVEWW